MNAESTPAPDAWFISSKSNQGTCVEAARMPGVMWVRDSAVVDSPRIRFGTGAWGAFVQGQGEGQA
ncbi:DUF397 domain-containing protein [Streptomycetaceae bacterium NBC_01309]